MPELEVLCIGNAIVDILSRCEEDFLVEHGIIKGSMNLIDRERAELLYLQMGPAVESSGGSAGNTAAGLASFGARVGYFGKVADDYLGQVFRHDLRAQGVDYDSEPLRDGPPTARSMIFVTPDGERSMNTYLGASVEFGPEDIDAEAVRQAQRIFFEGYLWDPPRAREAILKAAAIARAAGREVAFTLSDPFCVDRHRDEFLHLIRSGTVDLVLANERELISLYQASSFEQALKLLRADSRMGAVTRSERGSIIVKGDEIVEIEAMPVDHVVDSTGAGDLYAAGLLYGLATGRSLHDCGRLGSFAASLVIQQMGPRPVQNLSNAAAQAGLIRQ